MITLSIGDQARAFAMRSSISNIKNKLDVLIKEKGTLTVADLAQRLHGDLRVISSIDASVKLHERYKENTTIVQKRLAVQQGKINSIQVDSLDLANELLVSNSVIANNNLKIYSEKSKSVFEKTVTDLNSGFGNQSLFAGAMIQKSPILSANEIMQELNEIMQNLKNAGNGEIEANDLAQEVSNWFDNNNHLTPEFKEIFEEEKEILDRNIPISEDRTIKLTVTAADDDIKNTIKGLAMAAMTAEGGFDDDSAKKTTLLQKGAQIVFNNNIGLIGVSARIGEKESVIRRVEAENSSLVKTLNLANHDIRWADPAETDAALDQTLTHLDSLYKVTAAVSRLSLADYLR